MPTNYTRDVFAATLDEAIKASGMNQKDIADALDVTQQTVSKWVNGQTRPQDGDTVAALERLLGFGPGHLAKHMGQVIVLPGGPPPAEEPDILTRVRAARRRGEGSQQDWAEISEIAAREVRKRIQD